MEDHSVKLLGVSIDKILKFDKYILNIMKKLILSSVQYQDQALACRMGNSPQLCYNPSKSRKKGHAQEVKVCPNIKLDGLISPAQNSQ